MRPETVQSPLPILVGSASPRMLRITARHADEWNAWGAPDLAAAGMQKLLIACEREQRDPATIRKSVQALVIATDNSETVAKIRAGAMGDRSIAGTIDQICDEIARCVEMGFDEVIVPDFTFGEEQLEREKRLTDVINTLAATFP